MLGAIAASLLYIGSSAVIAGHAGSHYGGNHPMMNPSHHAQMHGGGMSGAHNPPKLGVAIAPLNQAMLDDLGLEYGVVINGVRPGSVAEQAGLQAGDIVTKLADRPVYSPARMQYLVRQAGDSMRITATRDGKSLNLDATFPSAAGTASKSGPAVLGLRVQRMTPDLQEAFGATQGQGVLVSQVIEGSAAADAGLKAGDVITAIDAATVSSVRSLHKALASHSPGDKVSVDILRQGRQQSIAVALGAHPLASRSHPGNYQHGKHGCGMQKRWKMS